MLTNTDFAALRRRFPVLERMNYLNSGSYGALADTVSAAIDSYKEERFTVGANWDAWVVRNESVRKHTATLLNADPDTVAITTSASAGMNSLASALDFSQDRNQIVVSDFEFPTTAHIWHAQQLRGARIVRVPTGPDGYIPLEHFASLIDEETLLVAVSYVCFRNGATLDIPGIVRIAHAKGAKVILDCFQAVGALTIDVQALDVDFAVGGMLKYLLGTAGIGFLYVRKELVHELIPTNSGWFAQEDIGAMDITGNRPSPTARRFEAGTPPVVNCYAAEAGLNLILSVGTDTIETRVRYLVRRCMDGLDAIGWPSITPRADEHRGPMVAIRSSDAAQLVSKLMGDAIVTSFRDGNVRASIHFYNSEDDVDALLAALRVYRSEFRERTHATKRRQRHR